MLLFILQILLKLPDYQFNAWFFMAVFFVVAIAFAFIKLFTYAAKRWEEGTKAGNKPEQPK